MTQVDAYTILLHTVEGAGLVTGDIIKRRCPKAHYPLKCLAIKRMREAGASWPVIAMTMLYKHHSQAMHAVRRFNEMGMTT